MRKAIYTCQWALVVMSAQALDNIMSPALDPAITPMFSWKRSAPVIESRRKLYVSLKHGRRFTVFHGPAKLGMNTTLL